MMGRRKIKTFRSRKKKEPQAKNTIRDQQERSREKFSGE